MQSMSSCLFFLSLTLKVMAVAEALTRYTNAHSFLCIFYMILAPFKICGNAFPNKCELKTEAIYKCKGPLSKPELVSECGRVEICDNEGPAAECVRNKCLCYADEIGKAVSVRAFQNCFTV